MKAPPPTTKPEFRNDLEFDDQSVDDISKLVFNGMKGSQNTTGELTKNELKTWTKQIMAKMYPNREFDE